MDKIEIKHNVPKEELEEMKVFDWEIWSKEASEFPWSYTEKETCYILEGEAIVTTDRGEQITIKQGDFVVFHSGLACTWKITKLLRKHYKYGE